MLNLNSRDHAVKRAQISSQRFTRDKQQRDRVSEDEHVEASSHVLNSPLSIIVIGK